MDECQCRTCRAIQEMDRKFEARLLLLDQQRRIQIPTIDEWVGLNLLDRDGELPSKESVS